MITCKEFPEKTFETQEQMFKELRENKSTLIAQKKMATKTTDALSYYAPKGANKAQPTGETINLQLKLVLNTTNIMDSHRDVHIKGLWKKTLQEQKNLYLLQEHQVAFDKIITDNVKAKTETLSWKEVGESYKGDTEALIFDVEITKERNPFMFGQYAKGFVKNHSVGMQYVKLELAINSESKWDVEEKEIWDKYISQVANKEAAEERGYFWVVTEAKLIEGSAVPIGSNRATPVLESKEAVTDTSKTGAEKSLHDKQSEFFKTLI